MPRSLLRGCFTNQSPPLRNNVPDHRRNLEQRLARRPDVLERLHAIADLLDQSVAEGCSADQAETRVIEQVRLLGQEILGQWAQETHAVAQQQMPRRHPHAVREGKKTPDVADDLRADLRAGNPLAAGAARPALPAVL